MGHHQRKRTILSCLPCYSKKQKVGDYLLAQPIYIHCLSPVLTLHSAIGNIPVITAPNDVDQSSAHMSPIFHHIHPPARPQTEATFLDTFYPERLNWSPRLRPPLLVIRGRLATNSDILNIARPIYWAYFIILAFMKNFQKSREPPPSTGALCYPQALCSRSSSKCFLERFWIS